MTNELKIACDKAYNYAEDNPVVLFSHDVCEARGRKAYYSKLMNSVDILCSNDKEYHKCLKYMNSKD